MPQRQASFVEDAGAVHVWHKPGSIVGGREHILLSVDCIVRKKWKAAAAATLQACMQDWVGSEVERGFDLGELRVC